MQLKTFRLVTARKAQMWTIKAKMAELHSAASVSGAWCSACWLSVTRRWLTGTPGGGFVRVISHTRAWPTVVFEWKRLLWNRPLVFNTTSSAGVLIPQDCFNMQLQTSPMWYVFCQLHRPDLRFSVKSWNGLANFLPFMFTIIIIVGFYFPSYLLSLFFCSFCLFYMKHLVHVLAF